MKNIDFAARKVYPLLAEKTEGRHCNSLCNRIREQPPAALELA